MLQKNGKITKKTKPDCLSVLENITQQSFRFSEIIFSDYHPQPVFWAVFKQLTFHSRKKPTTTKKTKTTSLLYPFGLTFCFYKEAIIITIT